MTEEVQSPETQIAQRESQTATPEPSLKSSPKGATPTKGKNHFAGLLSFFKNMTKSSSKGGTSQKHPKKQKSQDPSPPVEPESSEKEAPKKSEEPVTPPPSEPEQKKSEEPEVPTSSEPEQKKSEEEVTPAPEQEEPPKELETQEPEKQKAEDDMALAPAAKKSDSDEKIIDSLAIGLPPPSPEIGQDKCASKEESDSRKSSTSETEKVEPSS